MPLRHLVVPVVVPVVLALALTLTGCDEEKAPKADPATSAAPSPGKPTPSERTAAPADGKRFTGDGFAFRAPRGWTDSTRSARDVNKLVQLAAAARPDRSGFATNVNVVVSDAGVDEPSEQQLQQISDAIAARLVSLVPKLKINDPTEIADRPALDHEGAASKSGVSYYIRQFVAFDDGTAYTITFSFSRVTKPRQRDQVVEAVLASWKWA